MYARGVRLSPATCSVAHALVGLVVAGCSFQPGTYRGAGGQDDANADGMSSGSNDGSGACTNHVLPPAVNVDPTMWSASFLTAPTWTCDGAGTTTIDSNAGTATSTTCALGTAEITNDVAQTTGGGTVLVVRLRGLSITNGHVLRLVGNKPIVFLVAGDVVVDSDGLIDAGADGSTPGPGGSRAGECTTLATGLGGAPSGSGWGGGGGGFGTAGGQGCYNLVNGGSAVASTLEPLRGGCSGGGSASTGGAGGGGVQISASGTIQIGATGVGTISAGGGGGPAATSGGGNAGGSGGAILLVSPADATRGIDGALRANGGAGSEGCSSCGGLDAGENGHASDSARTVDASGIPGGGNGNDHGRRGGLADLVGADPLVSGAGEMATAQSGGRGGGGGGGGTLVVRSAATVDACD
jgi:hypothetical protein